MNVLEIIRVRLQGVFSPMVLDVIDDSHKHVGHAGSKDSAGHFTVKIKADCFVGQPRVMVHRQIYRVLDDLIPHPIHALGIILV